MSRQDKKLNALYRAAKEGALETVELLIKQGVKIEAHTKSQSPLDIASETGHYFVVEILLKHAKAQGVMEVYNLHTALLSAVLGGHHNIVKLLLHEGVNLEHIPKGKFNVFHGAASKGDVFMLETLLNAPGGKKWIDAHYLEDGIEKSPLYVAAENEHSAAVELLLHYGAVAHQKKRSGIGSA